VNKHNLFYHGFLVVIGTFILSALFTEFVYGRYHGFVVYFNLKVFLSFWIILALMIIFLFNVGDILSIFTPKKLKYTVKDIGRVQFRIGLFLLILTIFCSLWVVKGVFIDSLVQGHLSVSESASMAGNFTSDDSAALHMVGFTYYLYNAAFTFKFTLTLMLMCSAILIALSVMLMLQGLANMKVKK